MEQSPSEPLEEPHDSGNGGTAQNHFSHLLPDCSIVHPKVIVALCDALLVTDNWIPAALAAGVPAEQLELHLQPVHALADGGLVGAETFVRWRHPDHGWLPIQRWYAEAARSGALVDFARKMLPAWAACTELHAGIVASFNFSAEQLLDDRFMEAVRGLPDVEVARLAVEVDHRLFLQDVEAEEAASPQRRASELSVRLASLHARGFEIWLDDFGEISLDEVAARHPSVAVVKLDRSLLTADGAWMHDLVLRLHGASKTVLLEGIETEEHRHHALVAGIDWGQGFLYGPPLPASGFAEYASAAHASHEPAPAKRTPGDGAK